MKKRILTLWVLILWAVFAFGALADQRGEAVLSVAVGELGYRATPGGYTKYGEWGGKAYGEYCSEFVSWCVNRADELYGMNLLGNEYPKQTDCADGAAWYKSRGRYITVGGGLRGEDGQVWLSDGILVRDRPYVPSPGDLIYFEWYAYNRLDHVGIVEAVSKGTDGTLWVHTVEGNNHMRSEKPTGVERYTYRIDDPSIRGYGVLEENLVGHVLSKGSAGEEVTALQQNLRLLGWYQTEPGGKYGKATEDAVRAYQKASGLEVSGVADLGTQQHLIAEIEQARIVAAEEAKARAQSEKEKMIASAKEALSTSWFGAFDPYDEAAVWSRLMQPITVLDVGQNEKVYLSDAPNGKRKTHAPFRGYFYGESVAVRVLEERDDWTRIQAYNDCDELEDGWVRSKRIRTATPRQDYGIVVDKQAQRLYLYKEGKLLTELLVSTGATGGSNKEFNETASGEFLLVSPTGGFWSGNLYCDYAIRFNGGDLMHQVPSIVSADGRHDYSTCESALGSRASHGCIRVQRKENEEGYNHLWLWNNLRSLYGVKLIVWDDDGRTLPVTADDSPVYYNPVGGSRYHADPMCPSVRSAYLPLTHLTYAQLEQYPYNKLHACGVCGAPRRPEIVRAWNEAVAQAQAELSAEAAR